MNLEQFGGEMEHDLLQNILPFHEKVCVDRQQGGFYGRVENDQRVQADAPKGLVQHSRLLWTFAHAYRRYQDPAYFRLASRAYWYLLSHFWDAYHPGMIWLVDGAGKVLDSHKMIYGQAFAIYALSEQFLAGGHKQSRDLAVTLFHILEQKAQDPQFGGYFDAFEKDWRFTDAVNIDETVYPTVKSMNTHLHLLEAYTNLLRAWDTPLMRRSLRTLIAIMLDRIIDRPAGEMKLHFSADWRVLGGHISYGHDIEASWLLVEAAQALGDDALLAETQRVSLRMAQAAYENGLNADGSLRDDDQGDTRTWWVQAEAVVGFFNAYELCGESHFLAAALGCWRYIDEALLDRRHGEWIWGRDAKGVPVPRPKAGLWKTPYHNGRACMEIKQRLQQMGSQATVRTD